MRIIRLILSVGAIGANVLRYGPRTVPRSIGLDFWMRDHGRMHAYFCGTRGSTPVSAEARDIGRCRLLGIAMNFIDPSNVLIDSVRIERRANIVGIFVRSGCHCNPGVRKVALGFSAQEMAAAFKDKDRLRYQEFLQLIDGKTTGAVRASLGLATTFADVYRFWEFAAGFGDVPSAAAWKVSGRGARKERPPPREG